MHSVLHCTRNHDLYIEACQYTPIIYNYSMLCPGYSLVQLDLSLQDVLFASIYGFAHPMPIQVSASVSTTLSQEYYMIRSERLLRGGLNMDCFLWCHLGLVCQEETKIIECSSWWIFLSRKGYVESDASGCCVLVQDQPVCFFWKATQLVLPPRLFRSLSMSKYSHATVLPWSPNVEYNPLILYIMVKFQDHLIL